MQAPAGSAIARVFVWAGTLLFAASLLYCFLTYETTMGRRVTGSVAWPTAVDAVLFSVFALHHSVFARERVRLLVRLVTPNGMERSVYVWIASAMLIAVCALWQPVPGTAWQASGAGVWLLRAVQVGGVWLTMRSAAAIDIFSLAGIRQPDADRAPEEFKTASPYGWVRHPIYSGWFAIVFAEPTMTATRLVFAAVSGLYLLIAIPLEEGSLRATTGGAYERYEQAVRWKLVPKIY